MRDTTFVGNTPINIRARGRKLYVRRADHWMMLAIPAQGIELVTGGRWMGYEIVVLLSNEDDFEGSMS